MCFFLRAPLLASEFMVSPIPDRTKPLFHLLSGRLFAMRKSDVIGVGVLMLLPLLIFSPLFTAEYLYTDESTMLWRYRKETDLQMFLPQGRYLSELLFHKLFSSISTIRELTYLRLFSFFGWILSIPVWYFVFKRVIDREGLPQVLVFLSVLYMICMPAFSMYVSWAACMELFLADTCGLLSGYLLYKSLDHEKGRVAWKLWGVGLSVLLGIASLFFYQAGFGCFLLSFLLHLVAQKRITRKLWVSLAACFVIYGLYFLLFKVSLSLHSIEADGRTSVYIAPFRKLLFMLARPLSSSFHFTLLFNERSKVGFLVYVVVATLWLVATLRLLRAKPLTQTALYLGALLFLFLCIYIPGLVIKENYASNRTLFALNLAVFFLVFDTVFHWVQTAKARRAVVVVVSVLFFVNAWYNFHVLFLSPVKNEYRQLRAYVESHYTPSVHTIHFIRPEEDFFVRKYGITRSWDEFGVPSTFFNWVPDPWVRQVLYEKLGNRAPAEKLVIKHWLGKAAYLQAGDPATDGVLLLDVEQILSR